MFDNPYVVASIVATFTAILYTLYVKFSEPSEKKLATRFAQVLMAGLVAGISFVFVTNKPEEVMTAPFVEGGLADF